jgi:benzoylformate decarboxylase
VRLAPLIRNILEQHDLIFSAGGDLFTLSLPSDVNPVPPGLPIVHLDTDAWELGKNYPAQVAILGDPKTTLPEIADALQRAMSEAQQNRARARGAELRRAIAAEREHLVAEARAAAAKTPIQPLALMHAIAEALPRDAVVVDETISSGGGLRQFLKHDDARGFLGLRGGGIGWGIPAAVGAKLAHPDRPVVALVGDGSAMYTCQALWTAAHERLPLTIVILNNRSYRILKQRTNALQGFAAQTGTFVGMDFTDPPIDFPGLARSLGLDALSAKTLPEVQDAIAAALRSPRATLVDVALDGSFRPV